MPGQLSRRLSPLMLLSACASLVCEAAPILGLDLVEDHTAEIIESIKADMSINFMEAALLQAVAPSGGEGSGGDRGSEADTAKSNTVIFPSYSLTDVDGVVHTCTVREEPAKATSSRKKKSIDGNPDIAGALDPLNGSCATLSHGYWNYKWCHRQEIIQFHTDETTTTVISLGRHKRTEVKRANANPATADSAGSTQETEDAGMDATEGLSKTMAEPTEVLEDTEREKSSWMSRVLKKKPKGGSGSGHKSNSDPAFEGINDLSELAAVFDFYEGGDICDETGKSRSVKTAITCCSTDVETADGHASPLAMLVSIQEVSMCSYLVQVCSRLLCPSAAGRIVDGRGGEAGVSAGVAVTSVGHRVGGVLGILQQLEACFPPKKDSWWSYKLCFSTGISQYHEGLFKQKTDGALVTRVTDEFSLGKWDKSTVTGDGEDLIRPREEGAEGEGGTIVLEFTGGTECDLTGILRSSTVHLKCGALQEVRDVIEDRTCHYRVLAFSPLLCSHSALMPVKAAIRTVDCVAEGKIAGTTPKKT